MTHQISVRSDRKGMNSPALTALLRRTVRTALAAEGVACPCEVNILLTDDEGIHAVNRSMRQVDSATDVLSFPMFTLTPGEHPTMDDADPEDERVALGDMCISVERARAQASAYGHSFEREICYLCVHSVLHLLGYDHMDEGEMKRQMRAREEIIMDKLSLNR
jgi:probable rRNA maturation factor